MYLRFTKMHGLGNDFVVLDLLTQHFKLRQKHIRLLADRHFGIGCDQVLVVEAPTRPDVDFRYRIYNADGSEVEQCGNGARCFARFVRDKKLTGQNPIRVETAGGIINLELNDRNHVNVDMGIPVLEPEQIPFVSETQQPRYELELDGETVRFSAVSMGNPHAVIRVEDVDTAPVEALGPILENHPAFPNRVNVGFLEVINECEARLRVWERGVGETLACGTGACAALVAGQLQDLFGESVTIELPGGKLELSRDGDNAPVMMTGPATTVFEGKIRLRS